MTLHSWRSRDDSALARLRRGSDSSIFRARQKQLLPAALTGSGEVSAYFNRVPGIPQRLRIRAIPLKCWASTA